MQDRQNHHGGNGGVGGDEHDVRQRGVRRARLFDGEVQGNGGQQGGHLHAHRALEVLTGHKHRSIGHQQQHQHRQDDLEEVVHDLALHDPGVVD